MLEFKEFKARIEEAIKESGDQLRVYVDGSVVNGFDFDSVERNAELAAVTSSKTFSLSNIEEFYKEYLDNMNKKTYIFSKIEDKENIWVYDNLSNDYYNLNEAQIANKQIIKALIGKGWLKYQNGSVIDY